MLCLTGYINHTELIFLRILLNALHLYIKELILEYLYTQLNLNKTQAARYLKQKSKEVILPLHSIVFSVVELIWVSPV